MPHVTVAIPTLNAGETLAECVRSVTSQTGVTLEVVVIDNSGVGLARSLPEVRDGAQIIENRANAGFGGAVNQAIRATTSEYVAVLNDDAVVDPGCLERLVAAAGERYEIGMCAPQIRLYGEDRLDSAGMLICGDGSSKQRGHGEPPSRYARRAHVLFPSGCAALYKRAMLEDVGLFDESFFLYCEDTDLGLRARRRMWECVYVPEAVVEHRYSHSSGAASSAKAWYVERNRMRVAVRNLPWRMLLAAPFYSAARYLWHALFLAKGSGKAAEFRAGGGAALQLLLIVAKARLNLLRELPHLLRERRQIVGNSRMGERQFAKLLRFHSISPRRVAEL